MRSDTLPTVRNSTSVYPTHPQGPTCHDKTLLIVLAHRSRLIGTSTGVDPTKERTPSANWFWQAMVSVRRAGHRNAAGVVERACKFFEEIEVIIALAIALWSIATGPRATRAGSSRAGPGSLRALRRAPGLQCSHVSSRQVHVEMREPTVQSL